MQKVQEVSTRALDPYKSCVQILTTSRNLARWQIKMQDLAKPGI